MPKSPFEQLLDRMEWIPLRDEDVLYVTHKGYILLIGNMALHAYTLSNGQQVIAVDKLQQFFAPKTPTAEETTDDRAKSAPSRNYVGRDS